MVGSKRSAYRSIDMSCYEHIFIARPDIAVAQVEAMTKEFSDIITENGGKVANTEYWGLKTLAYKIKKNKKAHYVFMNIETPHPALVELERQEGIHEDVLRVMTIRVDELSADPSVMMNSKGDRDRRPPRKFDNEERS